MNVRANATDWRGVVLEFRRKVARLDNYVRWGTIRTLWCIPGFAVAVSRFWALDIRLYGRRGAKTGNIVVSLGWLRVSYRVIVKGPCQ